MDKNKFLNLCREVSKLPEGVLHIRKNVPKKLQVIYDGTAYYPLTLYPNFKSEPYTLMAALHSLKANSFISIPLSDVKGAEE